MQCKILATQQFIVVADMGNEFERAKNSSKESGESYRTSSSPKSRMTSPRKGQCMLPKVEHKLR